VCGASAGTFLFDRDLAILSDQSFTVLGFVTYAAAVRVWLVPDATPKRYFPVASHAADLLAVVGCSLSGLDATASMLLLHACAAALVRWGTIAGLASMALGLVVGLGEIAGGVPAAVIAAAAYVSYVARRRHLETATLVRLRQAALSGGGFAASLQAVLAAVSRLFAAERVEVLAHDHSSNRSFVWMFVPSADGRGFLWCADSRRAKPTGADQAWLPWHGRATEWKVSFAADDWTGHVVLTPRRARFPWRSRSRLFVTVVQEITPVLSDVYRVASVRARAGASERARLSRHIHDFTIQSLIATSMQLEAVWDQCRSTGADSLATALTRVRTLLQREILNLRDLSSRMRPLDVTVQELPDVLRDMVQRFAYDTGVEVACEICEFTRLDLSSRTCANIARIVQEALSNIRKHSGAMRAGVSLELTSDGLCLIVEDEGAGFEFDGRIVVELSRPADATGALAAPIGTPLGHRLPSWALTAIRESVRSVNGTLVVQSTRAQGARLEISIPVARRAPDRAQMAS
jgi:signal transduction histidine kinase